EIPELNAIRDYFRAHLAGGVVSSVETRIPPVFRTPAKELRETLPGDTFGSAERQGKFLLFPFASERVLAVNPMLTGRFQFVDPERRVAAKTCLVLAVEGGRQLRYIDARVMGKVYLLPAEDLGRIPGWLTNGPDLLESSLTRERWLSRIRRYRGAIKPIITKAEFVQGIGNAYSDEILWEAKINPYTKRTQLEEADLGRLYDAARAVMDRAAPLAAQAMIKGDDLDYEERRDFLRVHRRGGEPCPRCGASISEITANRRITSFCRACQPGGPAR
ncbi:MAG: Fpg/Nei family DNA glycosylase, partial [Dehalococcoidia bacterium]